MADLYGKMPSSTVAVSSSSDDLSTFFNQLLHSSSSTHSSASAPCTSFKSKHGRLLHSHPPGQSPPTFSRIPETTSTMALSSVDVSPSLVNFSDPVGYFSAEFKRGTENVSLASVVESDANTSLKRGRISSENDIGDYDSEGAEMVNMPSNPVTRQSTSKRSRAAEVHNLSEKRRRRRINERMKALQNLIPNSNKTDKASMLDDAIEYLKQLQLQVQMLSARNGLSLHPTYLPGKVLQPMQLPQMGMNFDAGNTFLPSSREMDIPFETEHCPLQSTFSLSNNCFSDQPIAMPSTANITTSENSFGFGPLVQANYGNLNLSSPSKDICRVDTPNQRLGCSQTGKNAAADVA